MRLLIAYDGSGYSHTILHEVLHSGLPQKANVMIISVCEIWRNAGKREAASNDPDIHEYFKKRSEQTDRSFREAKTMVYSAREELQRAFPEWKITTLAVSGSPVREILSKIEQLKPHLIMVGERGLSSSRETGLGSSAQKILATAKCSVRIVRSLAGVIPFKSKIIIGCDGSSGSVAAASIVASRQWSAKAEFRLITVMDPFILLKPGRALLPIIGMREDQMTGERKWAEVLAANSLKILRDSGLIVSHHVFSGNPRMIFPREAEEWNADTVFVAANAFGNRPDRNSLGCDAYAIADRSGCSVEVLRGPLNPGMTTPMEY